MVIGEQTESTQQACQAVAFEVDNGDGTKSVCMGCELLLTGKCRRNDFPIIGKIKFDPNEPEYHARWNAMKNLATRMRAACR